jgi:hypothetical protein
VFSGRDAVISSQYALVDAYERAEMSSQQLDPAELSRQLHLLDEHEEAGDLTRETANRYRVDLIERGVGIFGRPMDGPTAPKTLKRWKEVERFLRDACRRQVVGGRRMRTAPGGAGRTRSSARTRRRRSVRSNAAKARAPGDDPEPEPPLDAVPLSRFRRDVRRWLEGAA